MRKKESLKTRPSIITQFRKCEDNWFFVAYWITNMKI